MKTKKLVVLFACTLFASAAFAQGTINFTNIKPTRQIINDANGNKLEGAFAQLYAGTSAESLSAVGSPVAFYEGKKAGYFQGGVVDVGFLGAGFFQIKAWQGADTFYEALNRGESNVLGLTPGDSTANPPGLAPDLAGLESFSLNAPPVANAGPAQTVNEAATVTLDGSASSDANAGDTLTYTWTGPTGITLSDAAVANPTFVAPGVNVATDYTFTLVVNDGTADPVAATVTVTVVVDVTAPAAPTLVGPSLTNSPTPALTGTAEAGSKVKLYEGNTALGQADASDGSFSITVSTLVEGSHDIVAKATDAAGNEGAASTAVTVVVDLVSDPRIFTSVEPTSATQNSAYSYSIVTEDPDGDPLDPPVLSGTSLPAWLTLADNGDGTGTLSGTPLQRDIGDHAIRLDVSFIVSGSAVTHIYSNESAFAALKADGSVVTWGSEESGGDSSAVSNDLSSGVTQIYSTRSGFAALKDDGSVVTWAGIWDEDFEEWSDATGDSSAVADELSSGVTQIYSNRSAFAAVKDDGSVVTWGEDWAGGDSSEVSGDLTSEVTQIYSTRSAFAALKTDGSVVTWGLAGGYSGFVVDDLSSGVTQIYSNGSGFAALKADGSVVTWAGIWDEDFEEWEDASSGDSSAVADELSSGVTQIYSNHFAFAAVKDDGSVVTWGTPDFGGDSGAVVDDLTSGVTHIYSTDEGPEEGGAFAALKADGSVVTWGYSDHGGDSGAVSGDLSSGVTKIYSNHVAFAALKTDGSVVTWGREESGGDSSAVTSDFKLVRAVQNSQQFVINVAYTSNAPVVSNVQAAQRSGTKLVDIHYDVADADGNALLITVEVSDDGGATYAVTAESFSGDVHSGIPPGVGKQIVWDAGTDWDGNFSANMRFRVTANNLSSE